MKKKKGIKHKARSRMTPQLRKKQRSYEDEQGEWMNDPEVAKRTVKNINFKKRGAKR